MILSPLIRWPNLLYHYSFGITNEYRKRITTEGFSVPALQAEVKRLREMDDHISAMFQEYASELPHRGLTIVPAGEVNLTEARAELTLAHSKPEAKKVYGGGLHDYRHYEGKEDWDD